MLKLTDSELGEISNFKTSGVFTDIKSNEIQCRRTNIVVSCGDGDQIGNILKHHHKLHENGHGSCIHGITVNGGALWLSGSFKPLRAPQTFICPVLHDQISESLTIKGAGPIVLYAHAPCGAVRARDMTIGDTLHHLRLAKLNVKKSDNGRKVLCFIHIDWGDQKGKKSYFVDWQRLGRETLSEFSLPVEAHPEIMAI